MLTTVAMALILSLIQSASTKPRAAKQDQPAPTSSVPLPPAALNHPEIPLETPRCPNPDKDGKYHVGCGVTAPELTYKIDPEIPDEAMKKKYTATVLVHLTVNEKGMPVDVHVIHASQQTVSKKLAKAAAAMDESAVHAVSQYRFKPALFQGHAVSVDVNVEITYQLY